MPDRTLTILGTSAVALLAAYLLLVGSTIYFVSQESQLASAVNAAQSRIGSLEKQYYDIIASVNAQDPASYGLVAPSEVKYVAAPMRSALSSARN